MKRSSNHWKINQ